MRTCRAGDDLQGIGHGHDRKYVGGADGRLNRPSYLHCADPFPNRQNHTSLLSHSADRWLAPIRTEGRAFTYLCYRLFVGVQTHAIDLLLDPELGKPIIIFTDIG